MGINENYYYYYDFDNLHDAFEIKLKLSHGTAFKMLGCECKYYGLKEPGLGIMYKNDRYSSNQVQDKINKVLQVLSFIFGVPLYEKGIGARRVEFTIETNNLLSQSNKDRINSVENKIKKFNLEKDFFWECLNLLMVAQHHYFSESGNDEDAFLYYFKIIEKISKRYYSKYIEKHLKKSIIKSNKNQLKQILKKYSEEVLEVSLTENILNDYSNNLYNTLNQQIYGNMFGKIAFLVTRRKLNFTPEVISGLVKYRNKLAHGDYIDSTKLAKNLGEVEWLALNCMATYFFNENYIKIHIPAKRVEGWDQWF